MRVHTQGLDFLGKPRSNAGLAKGISRRSGNTQKMSTTVREKAEPVTASPLYRTNPSQNDAAHYKLV